MRIGVPKETAPGERRVALVPESVQEADPGGLRGRDRGRGGRRPPDIRTPAYREAGAAVETDPAALLGSADLVLKVGRARPRRESRLRCGRAPSISARSCRCGTSRRSGRSPQRGITAFSTDAIPRTTRAQSMDTLSSMANIAGYKGVLLAAAELNKYFPMLMTAAGMVPPAKVFVIGAGGRRPPGDRHRAAARRQRRGDRRPAGGEGADRERRRQVRRHRARARPPRPAAATPRSCPRPTRRGSGSCWPRSAPSRTW